MDTCNNVEGIDAEQLVGAPAHRAKDSVHHCHPLLRDSTGGFPGPQGDRRKILFLYFHYPRAHNVDRNELTVSTSDEPQNAGDGDGGPNRLGFRASPSSFSTMTSAPSAADGDDLDVFKLHAVPRQTRAASILHFLRSPPPLDDVPVDEHAEFHYMLILSARPPLSTLLATADTLRARRLSPVSTTSKTTTPVVLPQAAFAIERGASAPSKTPTLPEGPNPTLAPSPPRHAHVFPATLSALTVSSRAPLSIASAVMPHIRPDHDSHAWETGGNLARRSRFGGDPFIVVHSLQVLHDVEIANVSSFSWVPSRRKHARGPSASEYDEGDPRLPHFCLPHRWMLRISVFSSRPDRRRHACATLG
ncbi:hypothetical protein EV714DRAFT_277919 [Schizophyllum commune]